MCVSVCGANDVQEAVLDDIGNARIAPAPGRLRPCYGPGCWTEDGQLSRYFGKTRRHESSYLKVAAD